MDHTYAYYGPSGYRRKVHTRKRVIFDDDDDVGYKHIANVSDRALVMLEEYLASPIVLPDPPVLVEDGHDNTPLTEKEWVYPVRPWKQMYTETEEELYVRPKRKRVLEDLLYEDEEDDEYMPSMMYERDLYPIDLRIPYVIGKEVHDAYTFRLEVLHAPCANDLLLDIALYLYYGTFIGAYTPNTYVRFLLDHTHYFPLVFGASTEEVGRGNIDALLHHPTINTLLCMLNINGCTSQCTPTANRYADFLEKIVIWK